jgi:activator of 2-hydroxyglutaryl-CoA dehydratase
MYRLGIDIGSTTIKMALIEVSGEAKSVSGTPHIKILATDYRRHNAEPLKAGQEMMEGILSAIAVCQRSGLNFLSPPSRSSHPIATG